MTLMTIMLVLINLLLLVAIVMYFSPLGTMVRHDRQSPAAEDAKRTVSLFGAIQQLLSEHADSLEHVDHRGTANSDDDLDVCVEELRRTNKATGDSIDDKTHQLAAVLDKYGAIYRSERQELQSYTQHMHELDQMLAEFEKDAGDSNRLLLRFVREMVEENRQLQSKVSSCKIQVSELITKTAKSERDARTDSLTLLLNRRAWDESLERLKDEYPLSVALIDVDRFKLINDSHGHQAGDAILNLIGTILRNTPEVNAYRIGGDEFTLLLPHGSESSIGERIRDKVGHSVLNFEGTKLSVSISIGIATRKAGDSMESLLCRADEALYEAKDAGGNQVCCRTST